MEAVFDDIAKQYDEEFTFSSIGIKQRALVWYYLDKYTDIKEKKVLELNCGTGEDAFSFERRGCQVMATDASKNMIEICCEKQRQNKAVHVDFSQLTFSEIDKLKGNSYDFIFSNFGGLNCISGEQLVSLLDALKLYIRPQGILAFVVMPRYSLWENIYFLLSLRWKQLFRRQKKEGLEAKVGNSHQLTWYYNPAYFIKRFDEKYTLKLIKPIGLFIPPSFLEPKFKSRKKLLSLFYKLDKLFSWGIFSPLADHYLIIFQKK